MKNLKKLPESENDLPNIPYLLKALEIGERIVLSENPNWTEVIPLEHGVGLLIDGTWKLNGLHDMTGPEKWPDPEHELFSAFLTQDGRLNYTECRVDFAWKQFKGHPFGIMF